METIGKYRIEERIGGGGFGEVFRAYDPFIKRHVAIKTCASEDQNVADRFYQEAEIAGNLHHRNITTVYDFGVHEGLPYLIQEYLTGEDLDVKIKRRDYLPYTEKLLYLLQIARGLAYAHSKGFIHRDVKPANVRILEDGTAKLMDFGIAKLAQQESGLTRTGMTLGTAAYLSPEQVRGERIDLRTDIFSFGILAYELLTFKRPFHGDQISALIYSLLNREPEPITAHWPGAPPEIVTLVDRCLRKDAGQRFADGNDLVRELDKLKKRGRGDRPKSAATRPVPVTAPPAEPAPPPPATTPAAPAPPAPAPGTPLGGDPRPAASGAGGLEYQPVPEALADTEVFVPEDAGGSQRSGAGGLVILLVLAAVAAAGGWWLGMRGKPAGAPRPVQGQETTAPAASQTDDPEPETANQSSEAPGEPAAGDRQTGEGTPPAAGSEPSAPESLAAAPTAPPPAAPATGRIVLPRVRWTDRMTVSLDGKTYGLHRKHRIQLPPGTYRAVFELTGAAGGYRPPSRSVEVRVTAGKTSKVTVPIPRPGAFSVRPLPGRPQGQVSIDGDLLGSTPLSKIQREPGTYVLEILPRAGEGDGLREEITLAAGQEIILSFDLEAGKVRTRTKSLKQ